MLNEFVSVVISSNEEHRKLMEKTCLFARQRPVALIEVLIFGKKRQDRTRRDLNKSVQYVKCLEWCARVCEATH